MLLLFLLSLLRQLGNSCLKLSTCFSPFAPFTLYLLKIVSASAEQREKKSQEKTKRIIYFMTILGPQFLTLVN